MYVLFIIYSIIVSVAKNHDITKKNMLLLVTQFQQQLRHFILNGMVW